MNLVHLTASPFYGGPERQMLGLARALPPSHRSAFLSFAERGRCQPFLDQLHRHGFEAAALRHDKARPLAAVREIADRLRDLHADVLLCHGYKADLLGLPAARQAGIPVVAVARGWTAVTWKVRLYERLDRLALRWMDRVLCVSEGQARKVLKAGVASGKVRVIRNAIDASRFKKADPEGRAFLQSFFPQPVRSIVGAIGRLSPEKGFRHLVDAAATVLAQRPDAGFVLFGDGALHGELSGQIAARGLTGRFILAGFRPDLDRWLPSFDLLTLPSYTEGLPNVVLEAQAAGVPVVATAVGGTPEVVADGRTGYLVAPGQDAPLADRIAELLGDAPRRAAMGRLGSERIRAEFTFAAQARQYERLLAHLVRPNVSATPALEAA